MENQCSRILNRMMRRHRADSAWAKREGIRSLPSRIHELRALGLKINYSKEGYYLATLRKPKTIINIGEDDLFPDYE